MLYCGQWDELHDSNFERCWTEDNEMIYLVALWKYAVLRQRDDVHDSADERCCTEFSEMIW